MFDRFKAAFAGTLLMIVLAGSSSAEVVVDPQPQPLPEIAPAITPAPPVGVSAYMLTSRIGQGFASGSLRAAPQVLATSAAASEHAESELPVAFALYRVAPNPMVARALMRFDLPVPSRTHLELLDIAGRVVSTLANGVLPPGRHSREWTGAGQGGTPLAPGIYFLRLEATALTGSGGLRQVEKVVVLR